VPVKNVQAQKTVKPVKIVNTANTVLKMAEVAGCVNDKKTKSKTGTKIKVNLVKSFTFQSIKIQLIILKNNYGTQMFYIF